VLCPAAGLPPLPALAPVPPLTTAPMQPRASATPCAAAAAPAHTAAQWGTLPPPCALQQGGGVCNAVPGRWPLAFAPAARTIAGAGAGSVAVFGAPEAGAAEHARVQRVQGAAVAFAGAAVGRDHRGQHRRDGAQLHRRPRGAVRQEKRPCNRAHMLPEAKPSACCCLPPESNTQGVTCAPAPRRCREGMYRTLGSCAERHPSVSVQATCTEARRSPGNEGAARQGRACTQGGPPATRTRLARVELGPVGEGGGRLRRGDRRLGRRKRGLLHGGAAAPPRRALHHRVALNASCARVRRVGLTDASHEAFMPYHRHEPSGAPA
jgi:hypothetical protein